MTTLTTRKSIIEEKKVIGSVLTKIQKTFFDEADLQFYKDDNEEHLYWELFDCINNKIINYNTHTKIFGLKHPDIDTFVTKLTEKLTELFQKFNLTDFIVLSHLKINFFGNRDNNFKPLKDAYSKLEKIIKGKAYKEAIVFDISELANIIEILFWTARCDPSTAEYIFLFDTEERVQIHLCKYGNIHLTELKNEQITNKLLTSLGWTIIDGQEFDNFVLEGKIEGRKLKV